MYYIGRSRRIRKSWAVLCIILLCRPNYNGMNVLPRNGHILSSITSIIRVLNFLYVLCVLCRLTYFPLAHTYAGGLSVDGQAIHRRGWLENISRYTRMPPFSGGALST